MNQKRLPNTEYLELYGRDTAVAFEGSIMVSTPDEIDRNSDKIKITVGSTGCQNRNRTLSTGDVIEFDAGKKGKFEVRLLKISYCSTTSAYTNARLSVTKLA